MPTVTSSRKLPSPVLRLVMAFSETISLSGLWAIERLRTEGTKPSSASSESRLERLLCSYEIVRTCRSQARGEVSTPCA